jgi:CBS domain-containing protein
VFGIVEHNPVLALIGAFVFMGAGQERMMARASELFASLRAGDVCDASAPVLTPGDTLDAAFAYLFRGPHAQLAVVYGDRLVGVLARDDVLRAVQQGLGSAYVSGLMRRDFDELGGDTTLEDVRARLIETGGRPIAVRRGETYAGLLGFEDLARVTALAARLRHRRGRAAPRPASSG